MTATQTDTSSQLPSAPSSSSAIVAVAPPRDTFVFKCVQVISRIIGSVFFDLKVWGVHHVPRRGGFLLVANHQSYLDPALVGIALPRSLSYMAKSELFDVHPAFTWLIEALGAFPVRQGAGDVGAMKGAIARLQAGHGLTIYPEGSAPKQERSGPWKRGSGWSCAVRECR